MSASQKQTASKFVEYWTFQDGSEKGEDRKSITEQAKLEGTIMSKNKTLSAVKTAKLFC